MASKEDVALARLLNERLGVLDLLRDSGFALATSRQPAYVRTSDGSLDVVVFQANDTVCIETPRGPGIAIGLVNPNKPRYTLAPKDAIFAIEAYSPGSGEGRRPGDFEGSESLNHHIATIYVSREGLVLDQAGLGRASELYTKLKREGRLPFS